jgi:hypothetical protein
VSGTGLFRAAQPPRFIAIGFAFAADWVRFGFVFSAPSAEFRQKLGSFGKFHIRRGPSPFT